ncbi:MAG: hypothetical protein ACYC9D_12885 [Candidatus Dormibacteria bacterium]
MTDDIQEERYKAAGWTLDTLKIYIDNRIKAIEDTTESIFIGQEKLRILEQEFLKATLAKIEARTDLHYEEDKLFQNDIKDKMSTLSIRQDASKEVTKNKEATWALSISIGTALIFLGSLIIELIKNFSK